MTALMDVPTGTRLTDEQAAMVAANTGLISIVVKPHTPDYDDAYQDGVFGLARATQKFDPTLGYRFSTYAINWIRQAVNNGRTERSEHGRKNARRVYGGHNNGEAESLPTLVSIDSPMAGPQSSDLADLIAAPDDVEADALDDHTVPIVEMLHAVARDDRDHQLIDLLARGVRPTSTEAADLIGITREALRQRFDRLGTRLRHPSRSEFVKRNGVE